MSQLQVAPSWQNSSQPQFIVNRRMESALTRFQQSELESAATHSQLQDGISLKSYPSAETWVSRRMESAVTGIKSPELGPAVEQSQPQLVSSSWNSSQLLQRISRNLYPAAGTRVSWKIEPVATCIQPPELASAIGWNQPWLVSSRQNLRQRQLIFSHQNSS